MKTKYNKFLKKTPSCKPKIDKKKSIHWIRQIELYLIKVVKMDRILDEDFNSFYIRDPSFNGVGCIYTITLINKIIWMIMAGED